MFKKAFTLTELIVALAIVAILAGFTIPIAKNKMAKIDNFSYYLAYATVQDIAANIISQTEFEYDENDLASSSTINNIWNNKKFANLRSLAATIEQDIVQPGNPSKYEYTGHTCHHPSSTSNSKTIYPSACDGVSVPEGYSKTCLLGGLGVKTGAAAVEDFASQPGNGSVTVNVQPYNAYSGVDFYCFKFKGSQDPVVLNPADNIENPCANNQYKDGDNCKNCADIVTWNEYQEHIPPCPWACERFGMIHSASKNTCVLPVNAENLCEKIKAEYNISNSHCEITAEQMRINTLNGFKNQTPHITLSNGLTIYIASDLVKVNELDDAVDTKDRVAYLVYVDANGNARGKGILYQDVFPFYLTISGKVIPAANPAGEGGANSVDNMNANILYDDYATGNRVVKVLDTKLDYRTAACKTGFIQSQKYCGNIAIENVCNNPEADCRFIINKPMKFFR